MRNLGTPSQPTQQGGGEGVPCGAQISPITPGEHLVGLVRRDDNVDWDMVVGTGTWRCNGFGMHLDGGMHWDLGVHWHMVGALHWGKRVPWDLGCSLE